MGVFCSASASKMRVRALLTGALATATASAAFSARTTAPYRYQYEVGYNGCAMTGCYPSRTFQSAIPFPSTSSFAADEPNSGAAIDATTAGAGPSTTILFQPDVLTKASAISGCISSGLRTFCSVPLTRDNITPGSISGGVFINASLTVAVAATKTTGKRANIAAAAQAADATVNIVGYTSCGTAKCTLPPLENQLNLGGLPIASATGDVVTYDTGCIAYVSDFDGKTAAPDWVQTLFPAPTTCSPLQSVQLTNQSALIFSPASSAQIVSMAPNGVPLAYIILKGNVSFDDDGGGTLVPALVQVGSVYGVDHPSTTTNKLQHSKHTVEKQGKHGQQEQEQQPPTITTTVMWKRRSPNKIVNINKKTASTTTKTGVFVPISESAVAGSRILLVSRLYAVEDEYRYGEDERTKDSQFSSSSSSLPFPPLPPTADGGLVPTPYLFLIGIDQREAAVGRLQWSVLEAINPVSSSADGRGTSTGSDGIEDASLSAWCMPASIQNTSTTGSNAGIGYAETVQVAGPLVVETSYAFGPGSTYVAFSLACTAPSASTRAAAGVDGGHGDAKDTGSVNAFNYPSAVLAMDVFDVDSGPVWTMSVSDLYGNASHSSHAIHSSHANTTASSASVTPVATGAPSNMLLDASATSTLAPIWLVSPSGLIAAVDIFSGDVLYTGSLELPSTNATLSSYALLSTNGSSVIEVADENNTGSSSKGNSNGKEDDDDNSDALFLLKRAPLATKGASSAATAAIIGTGTATSLLAAGVQGASTRANSSSGGGGSNNVISVWSLPSLSSTGSKTTTTTTSTRRGDSSRTSSEDGASGIVPVLWSQTIDDACGPAVSQLAVMYVPVITSDSDSGPLQVMSTGNTSLRHTSSRAGKSVHTGTASGMPMLPVIIAATQNGCVVSAGAAL